MDSPDMESSDHGMLEFELSEHHEPARVKVAVPDSDNPTTENKDAEEQITGLVNKIMSSLGAELSNALQNHYDLRTDRLTGTGRWFSESTKFQAWLHDDESKTLICPGIPGSGKTLLATRVVDMLQEKCSHVSIQQDQNFEGPIGVAYVYYGTTGSWRYNRPLEFMTLLLCQLVKNLPVSVLADSGKTLDVSDPPTLEEITDITCTIGKRYRRVYIVVDALDEVYFGGWDVEEILVCLRKLQKNFGARILLTLRDIPEILEAFPDSDLLTIRAADEDIEAFLDDELSNDLRFRRNAGDIESMRDELKQTILTNSKGMFSWAVAAIRALPRDKLDDMRHFMKSLEEPSKLHLLDSFYISQVAMFTKQDRETYQFSEHAIAVVSFAKRRLTLSELQHALAFGVHRSDDDQGIVHDDIKKFAQTLISSCLGLLIVEPETQLVQWAHESAYTLLSLPPPTREDSYFDRWHRMNLKDSLARKCALCLALPEFQSGPCREVEMLKKRLSKYPFFKYACQYWAQHHPQKEDREIIFRFLKNSQSVYAAYEVYLVARETPKGIGSIPAMPHGITGMHLAALFGLEWIFKMLRDAGEKEFTVKDSNGHSPLWWAVDNKNTQVARLLVPEDKETATSLIKQGASELVDVLLDAGYDLNETGAWGRTLLQDAIIGENLNVARMLLDKGANIHTMDFKGDTPLAIALQKGQHQIIDELLNTGASTQNTTIRQWQEGYSSPTHGVMQLTQSEGRRSVTFLEGEVKDIIKKASFAQSRTMSLFVFPPPTEPSWLWENAPAWRLTHHDRLDGSVRTYSAVVVFSAAMPTTAEPKSTFSPPAMRPIGMEWNMVWDGKGKGGSRRLTHVHNLPDAWIPEEMLYMYLQFLKQLLRRWEDVCKEGELHLQGCREKILGAKGEDSSLTDMLLEDAQQWTVLRKDLAQHVKEAARFILDYHQIHQEEQAYEDCRSFIATFQEDIGRSLDSLDTTSQNLIGIEFNLVTIQEARKSVTMSASLKRLSWITFIFLPATFSATLFGMNVDALQGNPSWKWYILVGGLCMLLTFTGWLLFKFTTLEAWLESKAKKMRNRLQRKGSKHKSAA